MNEAKIANDLARMSIAMMGITEQTLNLMKALTAFYMEKMKDDKDRELLLKFHGAGEKELKLLREMNKKNGTHDELKIKTYDVNPANLKLLQSICEREGIAYILNEITTTDLAPDGIGDSVETGKITMAVYNTRQQEFEAAIREAKVRSGQEMEIDASVLIGPENLKEKDQLQKQGVVFIDNHLARENPIKWMKETIPEDKYVLIRQAIQKLPPEMRSTLIYRKMEDGTRQVGFLSKTEQLFDKKGNRYVQDKRYDASKIMKAVMASVNLQLKDKNVENKLKNIEANELLKKSTIEMVMKNEFKTKEDLVKNLKLMPISNEDKKAFLEELAKKDFDTKKLKEIIDKQDIDSNMKKEFLKDLDLSKNELYIVPMRMSKDKNGKTEYTLNTKESICIDDKLTVRVQGLDDLVIKNEASMKNNIDKKLTEFSEKEGNSFVVLTKEEFDALELGDKKYMKTGKKLKDNKIKFMTENKDKYVFEQSNGISKEQFLADNILDQIHAKQEQFLILSDSNYMSANEFLKDVNKTVLEVATKEDEITNKVDYNYQTTKNEVLQELKEVEGEIILENQELETDIYQAFKESDELIGENDSFVTNDTFETYLKNEIQDMAKEQTNVPERINEILPIEKNEEVSRI